MCADANMSVSIISAQNKFDVKSEISHITYMSQDVFSMGVSLDFDCPQSSLILQSVLILT